MAKMLTSNRMSPRRFAAPTPTAVVEGELRLWIGLGTQIRDARAARRWTVAELAVRTAVSVDVVYLIEAGRPASTEAALRLVNALGKRLEFEVIDPRRRASRLRMEQSEDPVH